MTNPLPEPHWGLARGLVRLLMTMLFTRGALRGREHLPPAGSPFILALNQEGALDILILLAALPRPAHVLVSDHVLRIPLLGWAIERAGAIGVRATPYDLRAIRTAIRAIQECHRPVVLFVDGSHDRTGSSPRFACGLIASRTGVPVVPGHIRGSQGLLPDGAWIPRYNREVSLTLGAPITLGLDPRPSRADLVRATDRVVSAIHALAPTGTVGAGVAPGLFTPERR